MRLAKKGQVLVRDGTVVTDGERQKAPTPPDDLYNKIEIANHTGTQSVTIGVLICLLEQPC